METVISVRDLDKSYRLYSTPSQKLKEMLHPFGKKFHKDFHALSNVSFEVEKNEGFAILGRNGSGKSTLLQILCGILQPTGGQVSVNGKISALLELGAGFNRDFTGRENVYMNGAINGFTRREMDERIGEIVDFADIGEFIDQPVKTYSSGMHVRLAFSCAVHVDPEILIVDEALSVGDFKFKQKCAAKINEIRKTAAVLLVSHSMRDVQLLCNRAIVLDHGRIVCNAPAQEAVDFYIDMLEKEDMKKAAASGAAKIDTTGVYGNIFHNEERITDVTHRWVDEQGAELKRASYGEPIALEFSFRLLEPVDELVLGVPIWNPKGNMITAIGSDMKRPKITVSADGIVRGRLKMDMVFNPGIYNSVLAVLNGKEYIYRDMAGSFTVRDMPFFFGDVTPAHSWEFEKGVS